MCFSAGASFISGAVLAGIGIAAVKKARTPAQRMLACIPLFFSLQQCAEGLLWLSLKHGQYAWLQHTAMYTFLLFAQVVWPVFVPLSIMRLEADSERRKIMSIFLAAGVLVGVYLLYCLIRYPVDAEIAESHILYRMHYPQSMLTLSNILYFVPAILPALFSTIKRMRLLGVTILVSYLLSRIFYDKYVVSVWCYFAAAISIIVLAVIVALNKKEEIAPLPVRR